MRRAGAPEQLVTERLVLRRPIDGDARPIFERYASDPLVTQYLAWPRHTSLDDTRVFLSFSDAEWRRWGCGPYVVYTADDERLIGSSGLSFESNDLASTGYVFAREAWGQGYASETLRAMTSLACSLGVRWLYGLCHVEHRASAHVMEKCGFSPEGVLRQHIAFPNISPLRADVLRYGIIFDSPSPRSRA